MAHMISITEVIKKQKGVTRYCNCDDSECLHCSGLTCLNFAKVTATVDGVSLQLCNDCLNHAKAN